MSAVGAIGDAVREPVAVAMLRPAHAQEAGALLARAFQHDPVDSRMFPDAVRRARALPHAYTAMTRDSIAAGGAWGAYEGERLVGALLTFPPGTYPVPLSQQLRTMPGYLRAALHSPRKVPEMLRDIRLADAMHPEGAHQYVQILGVDGGMQGRGVGSTLVRHALALADQAGVPSFIESSNPRNTPLYERLGYRTVREFDYPASGIHQWNMWHEPPLAAPR